MLINEPEL